MFSNFGGNCGPIWYKWRNLSYVKNVLQIRDFVDIITLLKYEKKNQKGKTSNLGLLLLLVAREDSPSITLILQRKLKTKKEEESFPLGDLLLASWVITFSSVFLRSAKFLLPNSNNFWFKFQQLINQFIFDSFYKTEIKIVKFFDSFKDKHRERERERESMSFVWWGLVKERRRLPKIWPCRSQASFFSFFFFFEFQLFSFILSYLKFLIS